MRKIKIIKNSDKNHQNLKRFRKDSKRYEIKNVLYEKLLSLTLKTIYKIRNWEVTFFEN